MVDLSNFLPPGVDLSGTGLYDFILQSMSVLDNSQPFWVLVINCVLLAFLLLHFTVGWAVIALMVHRRGDTRWQNVIWLFKRQTHPAYDQLGREGRRLRAGKAFWVPHVLFCLAAQAVVESIVLVAYLGVATSVYYSKATLAVLGAQPFLLNLGNLVPYFGFVWAAVGTYYSTNVSFAGNAAASSYGHRPPHPWIMNSLLFLLPIGCAIPTIVLSTKFFNHIRRCVGSLATLESTTIILRQASIDGTSPPPDVFRKWTVAIGEAQLCDDIGGSYLSIWRLQAVFYGLLLVVVPPLFYVSVRRLHKKIAEVQSELHAQGGSSMIALPLNDMNKSFGSGATDPSDTTPSNECGHMEYADSSSNLSSQSRSRTDDAPGNEADFALNPIALKELQLARLRISRTTVVSQAFYTVACSVSTFAICVWSTTVFDQLVDDKHTRFIVGTLPVGLYILFSILHNVTLTIRLWRLNPYRLMRRTSASSSPELSSSTSTPLFKADRFSQGPPNWLGFDTRRERSADASAADATDDHHQPRGIHVTIMTHSKTEARTDAEVEIERQVEQRTRKRRPKTKSEAEVGRQRQADLDKVQMLLFGVDSESPAWERPSTSRSGRVSRNSVALDGGTRKSNTLQRFASVREKQ